MYVFLKPLLVFRTVFSHGRGRPLWYVYIPKKLFWPKFHYFPNENQSSSDMYQFQFPNWHDLIIIGVQYTSCEMCRNYFHYKKHLQHRTLPHLNVANYISMVFQHENSIWNPCLYCNKLHYFCQNLKCHIWKLRKSLWKQGETCLK